MTVDARNAKGHVILEARSRRDVPVEELRPGRVDRMGFYVGTY